MRPGSLHPRRSSASIPTGGIRGYPPGPAILLSYRAVSGRVSGVTEGGACSWVGTGVDVSIEEAGDGVAVAVMDSGEGQRSRRRRPPGPASRKLGSEVAGTGVGVPSGAGALAYAGRQHQENCQEYAQGESCHTWFFRLSSRGSRPGRRTGT